MNSYSIFITLISSNLVEKKKKKTVYGLRFTHIMQEFINIKILYIHGFRCNRVQTSVKFRIYRLCDSICACIQEIFRIHTDSMISIYAHKFYRRIYKSKNRSAGASLDAVRIRGTAASLKSISELPPPTHNGVEANKSPTL